MDIAPVSFDTQSGHLGFGAKYALVALVLTTVAIATLMERQSSEALTIVVPSALLAAFALFWFAALRKRVAPYRYLCIDETGIHSWSSAGGPESNLRWEQIESVRPVHDDDAIGLEVQVKSAAPSLRRRFLRIYYSEHLAQANTVINRVLESRSEK